MKQEERTYGCLIIHGFAGSPDEVEPLHTCLRQQGYITECPILMGHEDNLRNLGASTHLQWIQSAEEALLQLQKRCTHIILLGFSMGGHIAANLAMKYPVAAVVTMNTPIYYWNIKRVVSNTFHDVRSGDHRHLKHYRDSAFKTPLKAMIEFRRILNKTKPLYDELTCPMLIAHGLRDDNTQPRSAAYIHTYIRSDVKQLKYYPASEHLICLGPDKERLFEDICAFVKEVKSVDLK